MIIDPSRISTEAFRVDHLNGPEPFSQIYIVVKVDGVEVARNMIMSNSVFKVDAFLDGKPLSEF